MTWSKAVILAAALTLSVGVCASAQDAGDGDKDKKGKPAEGTTAPADASATQEDDPDLDMNPAQPDFTLVNLPTTLRLPRHKSAFRVTHRFNRPLGSGDFGDLIENLFGLDSGAQIGLEYRFGLFRGAQLGINRTSDRTIEFFGQYDLLGSSNDRLFDVDVLVTIDGGNNFRDEYSPAVGAIVSYQFGEFGAIYVTPMWVHNANLLDDILGGDNDTFLVGLGTRLRIRPTVYVLGEITPRLSGYDPGVNLASFGVEKRVGGHSFQLNFSNGFGTTFGQIARGGIANDDWYIGFNITRKFF